MHAIRSASVRIKNVKIFSGADGVDIDSSQSVLVENVFVNSWDDAFVVKTTEHSVNARDVAFSKISAWTRKSAFKIGTESVAEFSNIRFENFDGYDLDRGCVLLLRDGARALDVVFRRGRLFMKNWKDRDKNFQTGIELQVEHRRNDISNSSVALVRFSNIHIDAGTEDMKAAIALKSVQKHPLRAILLDHITVNISSPFSSHNHHEHQQERHTIRRASFEDHAQTNQTSFLVDCINTFVSNHTVVFADLDVKWNGNEKRWPLGLSPGWPRHSPPPHLLVGPCGVEKEGIG